MLKVPLHVAKFPINKLRPRLVKKVKSLLRENGLTNEVTGTTLGILWKMYQKERKREKKNRQKLEKMERTLKEAVDMVLTISSVGRARIRQPEIHETGDRRKAPVVLMTEGPLGSRKTIEGVDEIIAGLVGVNKSDMVELRKIIDKYVEQGYNFAGILGTRLSFALGGDYDLLFIAPRDLVKAPIVIDEEIRTGTRPTQIEVIVLPEDLRIDETTYITFQPISYVLLTNSLALSDAASALLERLRREVSPDSVVDRYLHLALSVINVGGYTRPDFWTSTVDDVRTTHRFDFDGGTREKTTIAMRALKRAGLDFFPRAMFIRETGTFPNQETERNQTIYANLMATLSLTNQQLTDTLIRMRDLVVNTLTAKIMKVQSTEDVRKLIVEISKKAQEDVGMLDLLTVCPEGLSEKSIQKITEFLEEHELSRATIKEFKHRILVCARDDLSEYILMALAPQRVSQWIEQTQIAIHEHL